MRKWVWAGLAAILLAGLVGGCGQGGGPSPQAAQAAENKQPGPPDRKPAEQPKPSNGDRRPDTAGANPEDQPEDSGIPAAPEAGLKTIDARYGTPATEAGNLLNLGYGWTDGDKLVLADSNGAMYRMDESGPRLKELSDRYGDMLQMQGDSLFYASSFDVERFRMASGVTDIVYRGEDERYIDWMSVSDDKALLYNGSLIEVNLGDRTATTLLDNQPMDSINRVGTSLYYLDNRLPGKPANVVRYDLRTREKTVVKSGIDNLYSILVKDDTIYYLTRRLDAPYLCVIGAMGLDGKHDRVLHAFPDLIHSMNMDADYIYYARIDEQKGDYSIARLPLKHPETEEVLPVDSGYRIDGGELVPIEGDRIYDSPVNLVLLGHWLAYENVYGERSYLQLYDLNKLAEAAR